MQKSLLIAVATACTIAIAGAQAPNAPAFDIASIKPDLAGGDQYLSTVQPGGRYIGMNITTRMLIRIAYGVHDSQIIGGPAWTNTDRFDITAKTEGYPDAATFRDTARLMLRALLTDRFKLTLRREQRELPIYAMVVAKAGELGPRLQPDDGRECTTPKPPIPISPVSGVAPGALTCGGEMFASGILMGRALTLSTLAISLTRFADRVVVDETGLTGKFDWHIFWLPDEIALSTKPLGDGPSMFSAFRDQAGLKLEPRRRSVEVLIVERTEHPEPD